MGTKNSNGTAVKPVVIAGGSGTPLWSLSRDQSPRQFLSLSGQYGSLQNALIRFADFTSDGLSVQAPCVVGNEGQRLPMQGEAWELEVGAPMLLLESICGEWADGGRAAYARGDDDPVLVVTPPRDQTAMQHARSVMALAQRSFRRLVPDELKR